MDKKRQEKSHGFPAGTRLEWPVLEGNIQPLRKGEGEGAKKKEKAAILC